MNHNFFSKKVLLDKRISLLCWFIFPVFYLLLFYVPFSQPIYFDRAYLLYMSQVFADDVPLYEATTFGYTPFSTILVGVVIKAGKLFGMSAIDTSRVFGIGFYGVLCCSNYYLSRLLWRNSLSVFISSVMFAGLSYVAVLASVNAEPKLWVLLCAIYGILFFCRQQWFYCGISLAIGAMCWHVSVISLFACAITIFISRQMIVRKMSKLLLGVIIGTMPVVIYLTVSSQWQAFWKQAVLRKIMLEGNEVGESPLLWLFRGIYPYFVTEWLHFLLGAAGLLLLIYHLLKGKINQSGFQAQRHSVVFILIYVLLWSVFNTIEFQGSLDILPLLPPILIGSVYLLSSFLQNAKKTTIAITIMLLLLYNFFDAVSFQPAATYQAQLSTYQRFDEKYGNALAVGATDYYAVREKKAPTKYTNFKSYEEKFIGDRYTCEELEEILQQKEISYVIETRNSTNSNSRKTSKFLKILGYEPVFVGQPRVACLAELLDGKTPIDSVTFHYNTIFYSDRFYSTRTYKVYELD